MSLIETWKQFRFLVQVYGFTSADPAARRAAEFLFSCQTEAGDIRGFLANQYCTYYTGAILSLLIQAGYEDDPRVEKGIQWLLSMRQDDMGWSIPMITYKLDQATIYRLSSEYAEPLEPDRSKPFSHNATGMILRAFAAHSQHRRSEAARVAASLHKSRFFQPDLYTSYQAASYWVRFQYPFWWNNLVAALDSVTLIDPARDEPVDHALDLAGRPPAARRPVAGVLRRGQGRRHRPHPRDPAVGDPVHLPRAQAGEQPGPTVPVSCLTPPPTPISTPCSTSC